MLVLNLVYIFHKKVMKKIGLLLVMLVGFSAVSFAQYPSLTGEAAQLVDSLKRSWRIHADSAWEKAFPIVVQEAMEGRPYVP